jgi:hypothetical protein
MCISYLKSEGVVMRGLLSIFKSVFLVFFVSFFVSCSSSGGGDSSSSDAVVGLKSLSSLSGQNFEAGREIEIRLDLNASKEQSGFAVSYYFVDAASDIDENLSSEESTQIFIGGASFDLSQGDGSYDVNLTIPSEMEDDNYKLMALVELDELKSTDINQSVEEFADDNSILGDEIISISSNDSKADVEIETVAINEDEEDLEDDDAQLSPSFRSMAEGLSNPVVNFDVAAYNNSIILNDDNISFHGTLTLKSYIASADNVTLSACIELNSVCTPLQFYEYDENNNSLLLDSFTVDKIDVNDTTDVVFDIIVKKETLRSIAVETLSSLSPTPPTLKLEISGVDESASNDALKNAVSQSMEFVPLFLSKENTDNVKDIVSQIKAGADLGDYNLSAYGVDYTTALGILGIDPADIADEVELPDIDLPFPSPSLAPAAESGSKKLFSESFEKSKYGKRFGAGVYLDGKSELNSDGLLAEVDGKIKTKVLGNKFTFLGIESDVSVNPGSFEDTGYAIDVTFAGLNLVTFSDDLSSVTGMTSSTQTDKKKKFKENNTTINVSYTQETQVGLVSADVDYYIGKSKGYERTIFVSIVPVTVLAEAKGGLGIKAGIGLDGIAKLSANITPYVDVGAVAEGGVGALGYSAGAGADLTIIKEEFITKASGEMEFVGDETDITSIEGTLKENISNVFTGPNGKVYLYAKYRKVKWCKKYGIWYPCGTKKVQKTKNLANFKTKRVKKTLLDKEQTLFVIGL